MTNALSDLIDALAQTLTAEPRPEALRTAEVLQDHALMQLAPVHPAAPDDLAIRTLLAATDLPQARAVLAAFAHIPWGDNPVAANAGGAGSVYLVATLMGPEGPVPCADLRMGLFYQRPGTYYGLHDHAADETYTLLAGQALWTAGDVTSDRIAGDSIHHPSYMPHAFRAGPDGFLALWRWSGDISVETYRMLDDAAAELEA